MLFRSQAGLQLVEVVVAEYSFALIAVAFEIGELAAVGPEVVLALPSAQIKTVEQQ